MGLQFIKRASIRTKFILLPLIAGFFLLILLFFFFNLLHYENRVLTHIEQENLTRVDTLLNLFARLSGNHAQIFSLLVSTVGQRDEEQIYLEGKPRLYLIHKIEYELKSLRDRYKFSDKEERRMGQLLARLAEYKSQSISAIEMTSVDLGVASKYMRKANGEYINVNNNFLGLLEITKENTLRFIKHSREQFVRRTAIVVIVTSIAMILLIAISIHVSNVLSGQIRDQIAVMSRLAGGEKDTQVPVSDREDEIGDLGRGILAFKESLLEQEKSRRAEEAMRAKSEFLANMSHELRTPLHGILSFTRFGIKNTGKAGPQKLLGYFQKINESGNILLALLNDLLDLAKLESGKTPFEFRRVDICLLLAKVSDEFNSLLAERRLTVHFSTPDFNTELIMDPEKIMQVARNLLSNAVKFSPKGGRIEISVSREERSVLVSVRDQGVGVPEEELERIFDKFVQSSKTRTGAGGTGLGLSICCEIMIAHRGRIWVENSPEGGAVFYFEIPLDMQDETGTDQVVKASDMWTPDDACQREHAV